MITTSWPAGKLYFILTRPWGFATLRVRLQYRGMDSLSCLGVAFMALSQFATGGHSLVPQGNPQPLGHTYLEEI
mgnify:CR=1 FL=1